MLPIVYPETSVNSYHYKLRNFPEELRFHLLRGESLKLPIFFASITRHNIMHGLSQNTVEHADSGFREQRAEKKTKPPKVFGRTCGV